ncbi:hypothetical protein ASE36_17760 [Rhizobium sp. Root274]|uniref:hypothetical protein n=1 Tax=unclassified Rhizobium TaxID=2613769 RepID=UPI0007141A49|nr:MULTISPECIES: hypothetical protein [unclassified Rhizobium]KQW27453.1 hypothetical protein ASC71_17785 [Rhizobium sp. Root1240]KRD27690.1 hypothetical protein ASE36_17760 [Rhizobium sp. Root274]
MLRVLAALTLCLALVGCDMLFKTPKWRWNQKLTVSVMTPEGMKIGSAVTSARIAFPLKWTGVGDAAGMQQGGVTGEAVVVDLGEGRYVFALLQGYTEWTAYTAFFPELEGKTLSKKEMGSYLDLMVASTGQTRELARKNYPLLVTFDDIHDPASVRRIDPGDLSGSFGSGYRLNAITLSITDEPVTEGIVSALLPWLPDYYSQRLDGQRFGTIKTENPFANSLASGAFDTNNRQ